MSYTLDRAYRDGSGHHIIGNLVGEGDQHIAVAVLGSHLVAVRRDGKEYAVWTYAATLPDSAGVQSYAMMWGHYYLVANYPDAYTAFQAALAKMAALES